MSKIEQIKQGLKYTSEIVNTISISGVENAKKIEVVYSNITGILAMIENGDVELTEKDTE